MFADPSAPERAMLRAKVRDAARKGARCCAQRCAMLCAKVRDAVRKGARCCAQRCAMLCAKVRDGIQPVSYILMRFSMEIS
jgi:hypothetical protein